MSYTGTQAQSGLGTSIAINTGTASSPTLTPIGEITAAPGSGRMAKTVDATNLQSLAVEWISTLIDSGSFDVTCNRVSSDAGQLAVESAFAAREIKSYTITLPKTASQTTAGDTITFTALVEESNPISDVKPDGIIPYKFKLKVSGLVTIAAGS